MGNGSRGSEALSLLSPVKSPLRSVAGISVLSFLLDTGGFEAFFPFFISLETRRFSLSESCPLFGGSNLNLRASFLSLSTHFPSQLSLLLQLPERCMNECVIMYNFKERVNKGMEGNKHGMIQNKGKEGEGI